MSDDTGSQQTPPKNTQQSDDGNADPKGGKSPEELAKVLADLSAENKKYRQSYAQYKKDLEETQAQLKTMQEAGLAEQGKFKDLYEKSAKELTQEREQRLKDRNQWTGTVVASRFAAEAAKAGCQDPMALIKIANADGLLSQPDLVSEDTFEVNQEALKTLVEKSKKDYQILFGKTTPSPKDGVPKTNTGGVTTAQDLSKLKVDELIALAKQL